ncbi:hypothetical protein COCON_G00101380 [Conger conger]|uniref:C2H2-type domain-containing protein n=1 Tax=Conger conger TaxID=82655 RepID=A0A9Q1DHT1_CONCO|nr:hypothetical protein COCON_G00101380 [Conger conger]
MSTCNSFQVQVASIMEYLAKTAVVEITKLVDDGSAALRLEMCRSQRENEALKTKLLLMEGELRAVRGYGEETPDNSLNISFDVQVCDEFRESQIRNSGAAANSGEGPLCKVEELHMPPCPAGDPEKELQAELKQEPEEQHLTPTLPLLESADWGMELQCVWSKANGLGISQVKNRQCIGSSEHGDTRLDDDFSPPHYTDSQRPHSEKDEGSASHLEQKQNGRPLDKECSYGLPDEVSAEMPFPLGSPGECDGSAPCEASSDTSAEAKSPCRTEGQEEEFICTRCGKTFPDTLELKTHEEQHSAGKRFSCSECGKGFTSSSVLEKHEQVASIMEVLAKTAAAEITKLVDEGSAFWRLEMCRSQRENEALKAKLLLMEGELRAVRGYGEGTPDNSLNLSFEFEVCDESREAEMRTSGAAAANDGEGPLCKEEELHMPLCPAGDPEKELQAEVKQEPEEQPLTPTLPLLESADLRMELQCVWSEANSLGVDQDKNRPGARTLEHGDTCLDDNFSPPLYRDSQRPHSETEEGAASHLEQKQNGCPLEETSIGRPTDDISAEMLFPLGSPGECDGSAPCEASSDTSAEAKSPCRTEGQEEEFICTRCGKTFPDALKLKTHEEQHSAGKRFSCSECGKGFTSSSVLEKHTLVQVASILEVLAKTAVVEITKLVDDGSAALRLEMCRSQRENEALKAKLLLMEGELRAVRGYGEGTPGTSGAAAANGGEGPLCKEEELHMQPCPAGDPEKELQAELKQEPEEQPLTPTLPLLESADWGMELQGVWSMANSLRVDQEQNGQCGGSSEHGDTRLDDDFSPPHYTDSQRPRSEKGEGSASHLEQKQNGRPLDKECSHGLPDDISAEMPFPLGSPGECDGSAPCEAGSDTSAEAKSPCRTEGQEEEFICTRCGKTFPDALELKTHEEQHSAGKRFSCSECGKGFTSSSVLEKHEQVQVASILQVLAKTAVVEITKLVDDALRLEMCRSQRENEALKAKLLLMEGELRAVRGYGEGTSGAAAAKGGEGPLCKEEELHMPLCPAGDPEKELQAELKQEPEEQPLTPTLPLLESADWGMELQAVWSEANSLGVDQEQNGQCGGSSEHGEARLDDDFSPPHYTDSQRPRSEKGEGSASHLEQKQNGRPLGKECSHGLPDDISAEMLFPLGSPGECDGSAREEEFICTRCGKTFPDALELKTHEEQHSAGKRFSCSECGKGFTSSSVLEKHEQPSREEEVSARCGKMFPDALTLKTHEEQHSNSGAAAANDGEGPLCKEEELHMPLCPAGDPEKELQAELKQEPEEQPLTPTLPLLESADWGMELQAVWSVANGLGVDQEQNGQCGGSSEHGEAWLNDDFSPPHYTDSQRPHSEKGEGSASHLEQKQNGCPLEETSIGGLAVDISAEMPFPLGSPGECDGSAPCEASSDTSAEAKSPCRTEGQEEEFICTRCGKTFPDALKLKTHEEQHSAGKRFGCSECGKGFTSSSVLEKHKQGHRIQGH